MVHGPDRRPISFATHLWYTRRAVACVHGAAIPYALFVSREAARRWCRAVNADQANKGVGDDGCRLRPVRVVETLELR
jgi:hypothetical protein